MIMLANNWLSIATLLQYVYFVLIAMLESQVKSKKKYYHTLVVDSKAALFDAKKITI